MFQFNDKVIDELLSKETEESIVFNFTNKYSIHILYKPESIFMYVKKFDELTNESDSVYGSLRMIDYDTSKNDNTKDNLKGAIMHYLSDFLSLIKYNENPGSLIHHYCSFLLSKGIFNAKKLFIHYYNNNAVISCEYHTERELFYIHFDDKNFSYVKEFMHVSENDYDIYNPFAFISHNKLFSQSRYYKNLTLELAYLI